MKKLGVSIGLALAFGLFTFAGCGSAVPSTGGTEPPVGEDNVSGNVQGDPENGGSQNETDPLVSPLAVLDTVDVSAAFGAGEAEGWSFALCAAGDLNASYGFLLTSQVSGKEKLNAEFCAGIGLEDLFGIRSSERNALGIDLFGGGKASLSLQARAPKKDSEPLIKSFEVGFRHDGDFIWYTEKGEEESKTSLSGLKDRIENAAMTEAFERMENAFRTIPEEVSKGLSLRLAVEKLIDLGFTVAIDDTDGIKVSIVANAGFYTDLINDLLENFIPSEWLTYLPRADFRYEKTAFEIELAFDERGIFEEYSMSSDVSLAASLEVRGLFVCESSLKLGGGLSFTAYSGEIPGYGEDLGTEISSQ